MKTTDLCDDHVERLRVLTPMFTDYGAVKDFQGPVATAKVFEDNSRVRELLEQPGDGRVLVVDGGGSLRCALLGDNLAEMGRRNGWVGIVVYGCVRDAADLTGIAIGIKALNTHPRKSLKQGVGEQDVPVTFAGATIRPGDWLCADVDGVVIAETKPVA